MKQKLITGTKLRKWFRIIHRDLSFFFSGVIIIYAVSGLMMNHKRDINPNYTVKQYHLTAIGNFPMNKEEISKEEVLKMLEPIKEKGNYTKHYFPKNEIMKVFLKGGSSLVVNIETGKAEYEALKKRRIICHFNRLHYNPGKGWTIFSDAFAISLLVITLTGVFMMKGKKGLRGRGGIELLIGIIIPLLFILLK